MVRYSIAGLCVLLMGCGRVGFEADPNFADAGMSDRDAVVSRDGGLDFDADTRQQIDEDCSVDNPCVGSLSCVDGTCQEVCGNGVCSSSEDSTNCAADCIESGSCPSGMVQASASLCIDRYEASVWAQSSCTGTQWGIDQNNPTPPEFPLLVESVGCTGSCNGNTVVAPAIELYACSLANIKPALRLTWYQAKRVCENSGKRLCSAAEWTSSCQGDAAQTYPYGDVYDIAACNSLDNDPFTSVLTGSFPGCEGGTQGLFDMSGNLSEWVACSSSGSCDSYGGSFTDKSNALKCSSASKLSPEQTVSFAGIRCCRDL